MRRTKELQRYLNPHLFENDGSADGISPEVKVEVILQSEENVKETEAQLKRVKELEKVINGPGFNQVSQLEGKMKELTRIQVC